MKNALVNVVGIGLVICGGGRSPVPKSIGKSAFAKPSRWPIAAARGTAVAASTTALTLPNMFS